MRAYLSRFALAACCMVVTPVMAQKADMAIRAELAGPLQDVQKLYREKQYAAALKGLAAADAVPGRTEDENILIERLRAAAAFQAGEYATAAMSYERLAGFARIDAAEKTGFLEVLTSLHLRRKAFAESVSAGRRYLDAGGSKPSVRLVMSQAALFSGDYPTVLTQTTALLELARKAAVAPEKDILVLRANAQQKSGDEAGYSDTLRKMIAFYPQTDYWADLLGRIQSRPDFQREQLLDLYRLQLATGSLGVGESIEMAQLSLKQGFPLEAVKALKSVAQQVDASGDKPQWQAALKDAQAAADVDSSSAASGVSASSAKPAGTAAQSSSKTGPQKPMAQTGAVRTQGFPALYQRWLESGEAASLNALSDLGQTPATSPLVRLRVAAVLAQAGQSDQAVKQFEALRSDNAVAPLAELWLLHLGRAGR